MIYSRHQSHRQSHRQSTYQSGSARIIVIAAVVLGLVAGVGAYWFWSGTEQPQPQPLPPPIATGVVEPQPAPPEPQPALPTEPPAAPEPPPEPLPSLEDSDSAALETAKGLAGTGDLMGLLIPERVIQKWVRAIIALDEGDVVKDYRPLLPPAPPFKVIALAEPFDADIGQRYRIDPANHQRYNLYTDALAAVDKQLLLKAYTRYYPLLREAYAQYGVDKGGFHAVLLRSVEHLLTVKIPPADAALVSPKVFFRFHDQALEDYPAAGKLLWRMGPDNTTALRRELQALKTALVALEL